MLQMARGGIPDLDGVVNGGRSNGLPVYASDETIASSLDNGNVLLCAYALRKPTPYVNLRSLYPRAKAYGKCRHMESVGLRGARAQGVVMQRKLNYSYPFSGIQKGHIYSMMSKLIGINLELRIDSEGIISEVAASFLSSGSLKSQYSPSGLPC